MEELMGRLQQILNTPEGQSQLASLKEMFASPDAGAPPALSSLLSGAEAPEPDPPAVDPAMLSALQQLLSGMQKEDDNTRLLLALRPHFSSKRQQRVDRAVQLLRLVSLLPALRNSGIFSGI